MNDIRKGEWACTVSGRKVWPLDPRPEDIHVEDFAHQLANICRFGGACRGIYTVAEHCVRASRLAHPDHMLAALLHDASEAYIGDMIRPIKHGTDLGWYIEIESLWQSAFCTRFGLQDGALEHPEVKRVDEIMLMTEKRDLLVKTEHVWGVAQGFSAQPMEARIFPLSPREAHYKYLECFYDLTGTLGGKYSHHIAEMVSKTRKW